MATELFIGGVAVLILAAIIIAILTSDTRCDHPRNGDGGKN